jgi:hypothetical protein
MSSHLRSKPDPYFIAFADSADVLSDRERLFFMAYFGLRNVPDAKYVASQAIRICGYSGARANQAAYKMMKRPRVIAVFAAFQAWRFDVDSRAYQARIRNGPG